MLITKDRLWSFFGQSMLTIAVIVGFIIVTKLNFPSGVPIGIKNELAELRIKIEKVSDKEILPGAEREIIKLNDRLDKIEEALRELILVESGKQNG